MRQQNQGNKRENHGETCCECTNLVWQSVLGLYKVPVMPVQRQSLNWWITRRAELLHSDQGSCSTFNFNVAAIHQSLHLFPVIMTSLHSSIRQNLHPSLSLYIQLSISNPLPPDTRAHTHTQTHSPLPPVELPEWNTCQKKLQLCLQQVSSSVLTFSGCN